MVAKEKKTYFFIMIYRRALPSVWSSWSKAKDAALSSDPGSYCTLSVLQFFLYGIVAVRRFDFERNVEENVRCAVAAWA